MSDSKSNIILVLSQLKLAVCCDHSNVPTKNLICTLPTIDDTNHG
jgi:hypothetical protein